MLWGLGEEPVVRGKLLGWEMRKGDLSMSMCKGVV